MKDGGEYVINGTKQWITNGGEADFYTVIAMTDPAAGRRGASAFLVEADATGPLVRQARGQAGDPRLRDPRGDLRRRPGRPETNRIGREGAGFLLTMRTLERARVAVGAQGVGLAAARARRCGGLRPGAQAVRQADRGVPGGRATCWPTWRSGSSRRAPCSTRSRAPSTAGAPEFAMESSMAKVVGSDVAMSVALDAVQVFGGYGYMRDYPVEKMLRDAKILQIYEGTNQIQRNEIAQALVKRSAQSGSGGELAHGQARLRLSRAGQPVRRHGPRPRGAATPRPGTCSTRADAALGEPLSRALLRGSRGAAQAHRQHPAGDPRRSRSPPTRCWRRGGGVRRRRRALPRRVQRGRRGRRARASRTSCAPCGGAGQLMQAGGAGRRRARCRPCSGPPAATSRRRAARRAPRTRSWWPPTSTPRSRP